MQPDAEGKFPYSGSLDCAMKTLKSGGPFKFYTGFPVYCVRIAPHVMVCPLLSYMCMCGWRYINGYSCLWVSVDILVYQNWFLVVYADDMDFPQPDPETGEKGWLVGSCGCEGFEWRQAINKMTGFFLLCYCFWLVFGDSHPHKSQLFSQQFFE